ncbi:hypothetical protein SKAU_G00286140 [Synaphobranchus kaupii]|uniref:Uncharacterized protein n=1 Tax=Synaphobranchus kaupii TaxID=118154 RepID=A0A9Q1IPH4_SYNKA|nr:hypothetical protein SKAU_G00286140 [Synaphobranchus kaupii]
MSERKKAEEKVSIPGSGTAGINEGEPPTFKLLSAALPRRFGEATSQIALKEQLQAKERGPREKPGLYAAEVQQLTQRTYSQLTGPKKDSLALNTFFRGLRATHLWQHYCIASTNSLNDAQSHTKHF